MSIFPKNKYTYFSYFPRSNVFYKTKFNMLRKRNNYAHFWGAVYCFDIYFHLTVYSPYGIPLPTTSESRVAAYTKKVSLSNPPPPKQPQWMQIKITCSQVELTGRCVGNWLLETDRPRLLPPPPVHLLTWAVPLLHTNKYVCLGSLQLSQLHL